MILSARSSNALATAVVRTGPPKFPSQFARDIVTRATVYYITLVSCLTTFARELLRGCGENDYRLTSNVCTCCFTSGDILKNQVTF
jgi:hypothetical protein